MLEHSSRRRLAFQLDEPAAPAPFSALRRQAALDLLDFNDRDEPARLEPLDRGENAAALAYARAVR